MLVLLVIKNDRHYELQILMKNGWCYHWKIACMLPNNINEKNHSKNFAIQDKQTNEFYIIFAYIFVFCMAMYKKASGRSRRLSTFPQFDA